MCFVPVSLCACAHNSCPEHLFGIARRVCVPVSTRIIIISIVKIVNEKSVKEEKNSSSSSSASATTTVNQVECLEAASEERERESEHQGERSG